MFRRFDEVESAASPEVTTSLYGASDADTVSGEGGNDYLEGAAASDVYLFDLGDGQDTIYDNGSTDPGEVDVLAFGTGIAPADITVTQAIGGNDLVLTINGTSDKVVLRSQSISSAGGIDEVHPADGTIQRRYRHIATER